MAIQIPSLPPAPFLPSSRSVAALAALAVMLASSFARADAIPPPPESCPNGSVGYSSHCASVCVAVRCNDNAECSDGDTCQELQLCIREHPCTPPPHVDAGTTYLSVVEGSCAAGSKCAAGTCETIKVCASPSSDSGADDDSGCDCKMSPGSRGRGLPWSLLVLALAFWRRRTRGR